MQGHWRVLSFLHERLYFNNHNASRKQRVFDKSCSKCAYCNHISNIQLYHPTIVMEGFNWEAMPILPRRSLGQRIRTAQKRAISHPAGIDSSGGRLTRAGDRYITSTITLDYTPRRERCNPAMAATQDAENAERYQQWYDPDVTEVNPHIRHLLEAYSLVVPKDVVNHVNHIVCLYPSHWILPCFSFRL